IHVFHRTGNRQSGVGNRWRVLLPCWLEPPRLPIANCRLPLLSPCAEHPRRMKLALLDLADGDAFAVVGGVGDAFHDGGVAAAEEHRLTAAEASGIDRGEGDFRQIAQPEARRPEE